MEQSLNNYFPGTSFDMACKISTKESSNVNQS